MPGIDPTKVIAGPAIVTFDSYTWYTQGDVTIRFRRETWDVKSAIGGTIDKRLKSVSAEVSFTPVGEIENLAKSYPYAPGDCGKSIFSATDKPLVVHSIAGQKYTFPRAAVSKMPSLRLGAGTTAFGDMTFMCLRKSTTDWTTADSLLKIEAAAFSDTGFEESLVLSSAFTAAYGAGFTAVEAQDGFTIDFALDLIEDRVDRWGLVNARLRSIAVSAKFKPTGMTEAEWDSLVLPDDTGVVVPGQSLAKAATDLVITGTGLTVTIYKAGIADHELAFGEPQRLGELAFVSKTTWTVGVADPLWLMAVA
jgi:hypothetical protein